MNPLLPFLLLAAPVPPSPAPFLEQVTAHFAAWDRDHDGTLSVAEIDTAVADPAITGPEAAAIAALKRTVRSKTFKLPPLTADALRQLAEAAPAKDAPNLAATYASTLSRLPKDRAVFVTDAAPSLTMMRQGKLGNCFCLAPLAALLARNPTDVPALFKKQENGDYQVTLGRQMVSVTPPTDAEIALVGAFDRQGLWVNLYEKAVGTLRVNFTKSGQPLDAISRGGSAGTMLSVLTGHKINRFSCVFAKDPKVTPVEREAKLTALRAQLSAAINEKRLITCGTLRPTTPGITPNHAYPILGYDAATDTLRLWNPHGDNFTPKGEAGLVHGYPRSKGIFSMPLTDFVQQFAGVAFETTETDTEARP